MVRVYRLFILPLCLSVWVGMAIQTNAQSICEDEILSVARRDSLGYQEREQGVRCEGMYTRREVSASFDLVLFTIGAFQFDWSPDVVLLVSPPDGLDRGMNVRAQALPRETYYRMDGRAPMTWHVGDVLFHEELDDQHVGVFGWIESDVEVEGRGWGDKWIYVPLSITQAGKQPAPDTASIILGLRPQVAIEMVRWQYYRLEDNRCVPTEATTWQVIRNAQHESRFRKDRLAKIELSNTEKGYLCIEVIARGQVSGDRLRPLRFLVLNPDRP